MDTYSEKLTVKQFHLKTGLTIPTIRKLIRDNKIISFKRGNKIYIDYLNSMEKLWNYY